jgi:hypothetical protein
MIGQFSVAFATLVQSRMVQAGTAALLVPVAASTMHYVGLSSDMNTAVLSLIAGSAATGVFRLVQGRMLGKAQQTPARTPPQRTRPNLSVVNAGSAPNAAAAASH